jgi:hypothetical protein
MCPYICDGFYIQREGGRDKTSLDCVRDDELPAEASIDSREAVAGGENPSVGLWALCGHHVRQPQ